MAIETKEQQKDEKLNQDPGGNNQPPKPPELPERLSKLGIKDFDELEQIVSNYGAMSQEVTRSKATLRELIAAGGERQQPPKKSELDSIDEQEFINDPKGAAIKVGRALLNEQYNERLNPLANELIEGHLTLQKRLLQDDEELGPMIKAFGKDVDEFLASVHPSLKAKPNCVQTALEYVMGKNIKKVKEIYQKQALAPKVGTGDAGGSNDGGSPNPSGRSAKLSPEEQLVVPKQIKAGYFKDEADYIKWRDEQ